MKTIPLHIGIHKTGSTSIQIFLIALKKTTEEISYSPTFCFSTGNLRALALYFQRSDET